MKGTKAQKEKKGWASINVDLISHCIALCKQVQNGPSHRKNIKDLEQDDILHYRTPFVDDRSYTKYDTLNCVKTYQQTRRAVAVQEEYRNYV